MASEAANRPVALIAGGGTGVGAATALRLARAGYDIAVLFSRSAAESEQVAEDCRQLGAGAITVQADVSQDEDCRRAVAKCVNRFGRLNALVYSAGATQFTTISDLESQNAEDFQRVYGVNVVGAYQMARAAAEPLRASGAGAIVNVSSIAGLNGNGSSLAYVASKGALNVMTLALARILAPHIRVNAVLPGLIDTRWLPSGLGEEAYARVKAGFAESSALQDVCSAEDIAAAAAFLIVEGRKITGQLLPVEAGFLLGRPTLVRK
ncbi:SDR family NAD(P)-dependent oxidoreductase [Rhodoligotrophos defluvii]|uniref:SDR family NAD(P)-dependent oxidoreductase n=1 Tax=Rhodoligotrophos defluvii TaxID=2561934 RepID=UPI0010C9578D|nr:SDR family oxidoreductase [Rhodoligotrophos defluvii]